MGIEFTNKPIIHRSEENQLSFHDVFGELHRAEELSKPDHVTAKYDTSQPLVALYHFQDFAQATDNQHLTRVSFERPNKSDSMFVSDVVPIFISEISTDVQQKFMDHPGKNTNVPTRKNYVADVQQKGSLTERIIASISSHEGDFTSINNNDAGYGISVGIRQWNQKSGELPNLIRAWHDKHPSKFKQIFGEYTPNLLNEKWVRNYDMANDSRFMNSMKTALADRDLQKVQLEDAHRFVNNTTELAKSYGFQSEFGMALVCEMVNQLGPSGTDKALAKCGIRKNDGAIADEHDAAMRISRVRPDGKRFHNLLAQRFSPVLPGVTLA